MDGHRPSFNAAFAELGGRVPDAARGELLESAVRFEELLLLAPDGAPLPKLHERIALEGATVRVGSSRRVTIEAAGGAKQRIPSTRQRRSICSRAA